MKNLFGKMLVGVAGFAVAIGMSAFAADPAVTITDIVTDSTTGAVTVSGTIAGDAEAKEATIIVAPEDITSLALIDDTNIRYIDQETAADGAFSFEFKLATGATYNVWCGGTDVTVDGIGSGVIDFDAAEAGYEIVGTITLIADASFENVTAVANEIEGTVNADGTYSIAVSDGEYEVVIGRPGYLYKTTTVTVSGADVTNDVTLLAGNVVDVEGEEAIINLRDLQPLLDAYRAETGDEGYTAVADFNDDGVINLRDLQALLDNYRKTADDAE